MIVPSDLRDIADLLGLSNRAAGEFCSEVAWHADRPITYAMILSVIDAHPRVDPAPETVAQWIAAAGLEAVEDTAEEDYVELEYNPKKNKLNIVQRRDFRDAQAGFRKCPHGVPITQRCRICRPD